MTWTDDEWQRAADIAQFYLAAVGDKLAAMLGHPSVDVGRCEHVLQEAAERGFLPKPPAALLDVFLKSPAGWPVLPGDDAPPLL